MGIANRGSLAGPASRLWKTGQRSSAVHPLAQKNTKIHLAVDANGIPVRILVTEGTRADCKEAVHLIEGISTETLLADRGCDTNDIPAYAVSSGMEPVIPPKKNRKEQRDYDKYLYKPRHLVENCFLSLKRWRGIATRYARTSDAFIEGMKKSL